MGLSRVGVSRTPARRRHDMASVEAACMPMGDNVPTDFIRHCAVSLGDLAQRCGSLEDSTLEGVYVRLILTPQSIIHLSTEVQSGSERHPEWP